MLEFSRIGGRYSITRQLYRRGATAALLAQDERTEKQVVIEVSTRERDDTWQENLDRRMGVASMLAGLEHPNLTAVRELFFDEPYLCLVKAWEPGLLLEEWLGSSAAGESWPLLISLCRDVLEGLAALHNPGFLHRDVRPSNIWLQTGAGRPTAQLDGFDCTIAEHDPDGERVGSVIRQAPEVVRSLDYSRRSDVYAAGLTLYEVLTSPRSAPLAESLGEGGLDREALAKVPPPYVDVVRRAIRPFGVERFDDALDLLAAFDALDLQRRLQEAGLGD